MSWWIGSRENNRGSGQDNTEPTGASSMTCFLPQGATSADFLLCLIVLHIIKEYSNRTSHSCQSHMDSKTLTEV